MIKRILNIFFKPNPTEIDALISKAIQFKRYTHTQIIFQKMIFNVTDMLSVAYQLKEYFVDSRMNFKTKNVNLYEEAANTPTFHRRFWDEPYRISRFVCTLHIGTL